MYFQRIQHLVGHVFPKDPASRWSCISKRSNTSWSCIFKRSNTHWSCIPKDPAPAGRVFQKIKPLGCDFSILSFPNLQDLQSLKFYQFPNLWLQYLQNLIIFSNPRVIISQIQSLSNHQIKSFIFKIQYFITGWDYQIQCFTGRDLKSSIFHWSGFSKSSFHNWSGFEIQYFSTGRDLKSSFHNWSGFSNPVFITGRDLKSSFHNWSGFEIQFS